MGACHWPRQRIQKTNTDQRNWADFYFSLDCALFFVDFFAGALTVVFVAAFFKAGFFSEPRKDAQRNSGWTGFCAFFTARRATASTIQSKLSLPTECKSASGAGFMKSMA